jgi:pimeloyl-ACP methyl ester carboxylesterase
MMLRPSRLQIMESGDIPYLWILGARDNYINCDVMKSRVRMPVNGTLKILENSGHLGFIEEEERSLRILDEFIYRESRQHTLE